MFTCGMAFTRCFPKSLILIQFIGSWWPFFGRKRCLRPLIIRKMLDWFLHYFKFLFGMRVGKGIIIWIRVLSKMSKSFLLKYILDGSICIKIQKTLVHLQLFHLFMTLQSQPLLKNRILLFLYGEIVNILNYILKPF